MHLQRLQSLKFASNQKTYTTRSACLVKCPNRCVTKIIVFPCRTWIRLLNRDASPSASNAELGSSTATSFTDPDSKRMNVLALFDKSEAKMITKREKTHATILCISPPDRGDVLLHLLQLHLQRMGRFVRYIVSVCLVSRLQPSLLPLLQLPQTMRRPTHLRSSVYHPRVPRPLCVSQPDVLSQRERKERMILRQRRRRPPQICHTVPRDRDPINKNRVWRGRRIIKPREEFQDGGFSTSVGTNDDNELSGFNG